MLPLDTYFYLVNIGIMMCPTVCYSGIKDSEFFKVYPETRCMNGQPWYVVSLKASSKGKCIIKQFVSQTKWDCEPNSSAFVNSDLPVDAEIQFNPWKALQLFS